MPGSEGLKLVAENGLPNGIVGNNSIYIPSKVLHIEQYGLSPTRNTGLDL